MRRRPALRALLALLCALVTAVTPARADTEPARLDEAKELFRRGVALLTAGDTERALEAFLRSREIVPSGKNTTNAAICLERLGRYDEALEMYEEVLARFAADMDDEDRANLGPVMGVLRQKIGYLELSSNVDGLVVVDGRARGRLPLRTALRVLPGSRSVRVVKDGYKSFERRVEVVAAKTFSLDAELEPLTGTGAVRIETPGDVPVDVFIDGARVGTTPWEGTLRGGRRVLRVEGANMGSAPQIVDVIEGKTLLLRVSLRPLGSSVTLAGNPGTATISLGSVPLGRGRWTGRLPVGRYELHATEDGYIPSSTSFVVRTGTAPTTVRVELRRDPDHPRWPKARRWKFDIGVRLAPWIAPTLHAGAESGCPGLCAKSRAALGGAGALVAGAEHDGRFGAELMGGYAAFEQSFSRVVTRPFAEGTATFALEQESLARGPFLALRGRTRLRTPLGVDVTGAVGAGVLFGQYRTEVAGAAWTDDSPVEVVTSGRATASGASPLASVALGAERGFGALGVSASLGFWFFPATGPRYDGPEIGVPPDCSDTAPVGAVGCVPESDALKGERAHGSFWAFVPELGVRYSF